MYVRVYIYKCNVIYIYIHIPVYIYIYIYIYKCADLISALQYTRGVWAQMVLGHKLHDRLRCGIVDPIRYLSDVSILARLHM